MTLIEKRLRALFRSVSSTIAELEEDIAPKTVHRLRTSVRRIESALAYAHPNLGRKQQQGLDELGKLRKRAGKVRDGDVQLKLLDNIGNGSTAADRLKLEEFLSSRRSRHARRLLGEIQNLQKAKFPARLTRLGEQAQSSIAASGQDANSPLREAEKQVAGLARKLDGETQLKIKKLHQVRIALKLVRYMAELADESKEQQVFLHDLKAVQDLLGDWHDWEELSRTAKKQLSGRTNCPLVGEIRALFTAKQASAHAAVVQLLLQYGTGPARKPPRSVSAAAVARRTS